MNFHSKDHEAMTGRNGDNLQDEKMIGAILGRITHPETQNKSSYLRDDSCLFYVLLYLKVYKGESHNDNTTIQCQ